MYLMWLSNFLRFHCHFRLVLGPGVEFEFERKELGKIESLEGQVSKEPIFAA